MAGKGANVNTEVLVRYTQKFWGEEITTSYVKIIDTEAEISGIYEALYEDPCVKKVEVIVLPKLDTRQGA